MYQSYFGLHEAPFSIAPAPRYLFMSQRHQEALAHLLYGMGGEGGIVLLTGEVGAGKTTVCRTLLEQIPEACDVAYVFNPKLTVEELLATICSEFGIACPAGNTSIKVFIDAINAYLLDAHARGRNTVLIIDEAQNLSAEVLEQMRLLTNLETNERKLLQIVLIGQPELADMLARPELRQLAQRIVARYHLAPLSKPEVGTYIRHRLEVAGTQRQLFPQSLMGLVYRLSGGIPRVINLLCDRALLGAYAQGKERVDRRTLLRAAREVSPLTSTSRGRWWQLAALALALSLLVGAALLGLWSGKKDAAPEPATVARVGVAADKPKTGSQDVLAGTPLSWPAGLPRSQSESRAYAALFHSWGVTYPGGDPCGLAEAQGLRCRSARGGLDELRQLNRPAVLRLNAPDGGTFFAALIRLGPRSATFSLAGEKRSLALGVLAAQWSGDYSLFWRWPQAVQGTLRPGDRGPGVVWLRAQLARIQGEKGGKRDAAGPAELFDDALVARVKLFQLEQGLNPDGSVGPQTLIRLANAVDDGAPSLDTDAGD